LQKRKLLAKPWRVLDTNLDTNLKSLLVTMRTPPDSKPKRPPGQTQVIALSRRPKVLCPNKRSSPRRTVERDPRLRRSGRKKSSDARRSLRRSNSVSRNNASWRKSGGNLRSSASWMSGGG
jgi:hypothetical protein